MYSLYKLAFDCIFLKQWNYRECFNGIVFKGMVSATGPAHSLRSTQGVCVCVCVCVREGQEVGLECVCVCVCVCLCEYCVALMCVSVV